MPDKPIRQPVLRLARPIGSKEDLATIRDNLSAIVLDGDHLWLGGDEGTAIDRMTLDDKGNFGDHRRFDLSGILKLPVPGAGESEIDIEGLDVDQGYVWLTGSHSLKRKKPEGGKSAAKNRKRLARVESDGNRYTLARFPLSGGAEPVKKAGALRAARLEGDDDGDLLSREFKKCPALKPFCAIPSKDNGVDVEGLAVRGERIFAGLRGPVLRGWAVIAEFEWKDQGKGCLGMSRFRTHFIQLNGLGVRELAIRGKDLYVLAGPTMNLDGPVFVYRWRKALDQKSAALISRNRIQKVLTVPYGNGVDHAEGITLAGSGRELMVCYDSPSGDRLDGDNGVRADVFALDEGKF